MTKNKELMTRNKEIETVLKNFLLEKEIELHKQRRYVVRTQQANVQSEDESELNNDSLSNIEEQESLNNKILSNSSS